MPTFVHHFTEDPAVPLIMITAAEAVLLTTWYYRRFPEKAVFLVIPVLLAGAVVSLDLAVETDREAIQRISYQMVQEYREGRIEDFAEGIAPSYSGYLTSRKRFLDTLRNKQKFVASVKILAMEEIIINGGKAGMLVHTKITPLESMASGKSLVPWWNIGWRKFTEGWKIINIKLHSKSISGY